MIVHALQEPIQTVSMDGIRQIARVAKPAVKKSDSTTNAVWTILDSRVNAGISSI
jgi:hypothetical protein